MCGRYTLYITPTDLSLRYNALNNNIKFSPKNEIYPGENAPVITIDNNSDKKQLSLFNWGFSPSYTNKKIINARAETIDQKKTFEKPFKNKKCIIPATSFFEWKNKGKNKIKHEIYLKNEKIFSLAGIYDKFTDKNGNKITCYTIITTNANKALEDIHNRMPVIITKEKEDFWLKSSDYSKLKDLLTSYNQEMKIENENDQLSLF